MAKKYKVVSERDGGYAGFTIFFGPYESKERAEQAKVGLIQHRNKCGNNYTEKDLRVVACS